MNQMSIIKTINMAKKKSNLKNKKSVSKTSEKKKKNKKD